MGYISPLSRQDTESSDTFEKLIENAFTFPLRYQEGCFCPFRLGVLSGQQTLGKEWRSASSCAASVSLHPEV